MLNMRAIRMSSLHLRERQEGKESATNGLRSSMSVFYPERRVPVGPEGTVRKERKKEG